MIEVEIRRDIIYILYDNKELHFVVYHKLEDGELRLAERIIINDYTIYEITRMIGLAITKANNSLRLAIKSGVKTPDEYEELATNPEEQLKVDMEESDYKEYPVIIMK